MRKSVLALPVVLPHLCINETTPVSPVNTAEAALQSCFRELPENPFSKEYGRGSRKAIRVGKVLFLNDF